MPYLTRQGSRLHYLDEGRGLPVLLLHAFPLNGEMFRPQLAALASKYRFLVPDHRGFGQSDTVPGVAQMSAMAEDALLLLDTLKIDAAVVGGVSMGGYVSMALLRRDPARVKALVLADTQALADDEAGRQRRMQTLEGVRRGGMQVLADGMVPKLMSPRAPEALKAQVRAQILSNPVEGTQSAILGLADRPDSRDILARFGGRALVLVGDEDGLTPPERADEMTRLITQSTKVVIEGAGHLANLERPEAVNRALDDFLHRL